MACSHSRRVRHPTKETSMALASIRRSQRKRRSIANDERCSTNVVDDCTPEESQRIETCSHYSPISGYLKTPFGLQNHAFSMSDLDWELASARHQMFKDDIRFEVWKAHRSNWTDEDNRLHTFWMNWDPKLLPMREWPFDGVTIFEKGNLRLSGGSMAAIIHLAQFPVKPQLVLNFANEDFVNLEPDWGKFACEKQILILRYTFRLFHSDADTQMEYGKEQRRNFMHYCFLAVNAISNFVEMESTCQQCGQERQVHVLIVCEGSSKPVAILLVCIMFFGHISCKNAFRLLFERRKSLLSLVDSEQIMDALFEFDHFCHYCTE